MGNLVLSDETGAQFGFGIADDGRMTLLPLGTIGAAQQGFTMVDLARQNVFLLTLQSAVGGEFIETINLGPFQPATQQYAGNPPNFLSAHSPSGFFFALAIDTSTVPNGRLGSAKLPGRADADPVVGQLFNKDTKPWLVPGVQPGGVGTPVTVPVETVGEMLGLWVFGCGHFFNQMEVCFTTVVNQQAALLCCPMCRYIQRIIVPASDIYTDQNAVLIA